MKKNIIFALLIFIAHFIFTDTPVAYAKADVELLPDIAMKVPENTTHINYLGLKGEPGTPFKISEIDADILLIELFSMYCPHCQKAAPTVNELYEKMEQEKRPDLKLVIIGIGAKNTDLEVETFRKGFDIAFPLFSDPDLSIYETLAGAGTPTFIGCKKGEENKKLIFFRKSGGIKDPDKFFDDLISRSGLQQVKNAR
ncbi:MAG: TlpA family protein disulfide reductase [Desulfocapsa sp.]|nr:TlpA family protein disulfide reductase [Desulfocapsa sp.]